MLSSDFEPTKQQQEILQHLQKLSGLNLKQMRRLYKSGMALNNFNVLHRSDGDTEKLKKTMDMDSLYIGNAILKTAGEEVRIVVRGR